MNITLLSTGTGEDLTPFIALGNYLQTAGFAITNALPEKPAGIAQNESIRYIPLDDNYYEILSDKISEARPQDEADIRRIVRSMRQADLSFISEMANAAFHACENADIIICHVALSIFTQSIAEKLKSVFITAVPDFDMTARIFPGVGKTNRFDLQGVYNRVTGRVTGYILWRMFGSEVNHFRRETLGLATPHSALSYQEQGMRLVPTLSATKYQLTTIPENWGDENITITEPWTTAIGSTNAGIAIQQIYQKTQNH